LWTLGRTDIEQHLVDEGEDDLLISLGGHLVNLAGEL
jgi:hypothetical protein